MPSSRFKKGQTVYLHHGESSVLRGLMDDPDSALIYLAKVPPRDRFQKVKARLGLPGGLAFRDGTVAVEVLQASLRLTPKVEQIAEEQEVIARYPDRSAGARQ